VIILTIRTDNPKAEIGLYADNKILVQKTWSAHHQLAESILGEINKLVSQQGLTLQSTGVEGIVCYRGPGSFTGLRIGLAVANTLSYSWGVPIVGTTGKDWLKHGASKLIKGVNEIAVMPKYGHPVHITQPKK
jgi:tRNA threonylcarbamoyladenosine biosynthesis protein TsaB